MRITITHEGSVCTNETDDFPPRTLTHIDVEENEFFIDVEGVGELGSTKLKNMVKSERLYKIARWRMLQIVILCVLLLVLDVYLFFWLPFQLVAYYDMVMDIDFSPIPIGATIAICGIQAGWIAAMFYQYKEETMKADYIFRGKEAYPSNPEK